MDPSLARVLTEIEVSMLLSGSMYVTKKTVFSTQRISMAAKKFSEAKLHR
jgi:hypothetical protein